MSAAPLLNEGGEHWSVTVEHQVVAVRSPRPGIRVPLRVGEIRVFCADDDGSQTLSADEAEAFAAALVEAASIQRRHAVPTEWRANA